MARVSALARTLGVLPLLLAAALGISRAPAAAQQRQIDAANALRHVYDSLLAESGNRSDALSAQNERFSDAMRIRETLARTAPGTARLTAAEADVFEAGMQVSAATTALDKADRALTQKRREYKDALFALNTAFNDLLNGAAPAAQTSLRNGIRQVDSELAALDQPIATPNFYPAVRPKSTDTYEDLVGKAGLALRQITDGDGTIAAYEKELRDLEARRTREQMNGARGADPFDQGTAPVGAAGRAAGAGRTGGPAGRSTQQQIDDIKKVIEVLRGRKLELQNARAELLRLAPR